MRRRKQKAYRDAGLWEYDPWTHEILQRRAAGHVDLQQYAPGGVWTSYSDTTVKILQ